MAASFISVVIALPIILTAVLLPVSLLAALQVWMCRKGKWLGLVLPALSLLMSLTLCLSMPAYGTAGGGNVQVYDGHGNPVEVRPAPQEEQALSLFSLAPAALMFLAGNVPTAVFGGIWLYFKNRRDRQEDLMKMRIEDLE